MAHEKSIDELERDVEQARARVAADIALLRSPEMFEAAKAGLIGSATGYRDQMRDKATGYGDGVVESLKAKAAANPLAVVAIGAGIALRLYKHPPVTTVLVGLGLASLLRTDPADDSMHPRRLMEAATEKAVEFKDRAAAQVAELREQAVGAMEEKAEEWSAAAGGAYEAATERVAALTGSSDDAQRSFSHTGDPEALGARNRAMRAPTADLPYPSDDMRRLSNRSSGVGEHRDAYLLGIAALAVGAAVGLARRQEPAYVADDIEHDDFDDGRRVVWRRY